MITLSFTPEDKAALDHCVRRTSMPATTLIRRLVWAYAEGRMRCPDLIDLQEKPFKGKAKS